MFGVCHWRMQRRLWRRSPKHWGDAIERRRWETRMSVSILVKHPEMAAQLDRLLPLDPCQLRVPIIVKPRGASPQLVGTAFDYALLFELQRRFGSMPHRPWVAQRALEEIRERTEKLRRIQARMELSAYERLLARADLRVRNARIFVKKHLKRRTLTH